MKRKIVIGIAAVAVAIMAIALTGMWLDFCDMEIRRQVEGFEKVLINNPHPVQNPQRGDPARN